ncbi:MAG: hypothetical protein OXI96_03445 [Acidimicrobiaceae bacterium]|nr:hypothetical protein [Acidimicrobiaceae bacterium]
MFYDPIPRHFISYSATDQKTVRELRGQYDGILVPGTVAAFQREGTAGFVLSMSSSETRPPYVIDPRFPLFQQQLPKVKRSHSELAKLLGDESLACADTWPSPKDFSDERTTALASSWVKFNLQYRDKQSAKFDKYAKRLGKQLDIAEASGPQRILAPYFCVSGLDDPWWEKSVALYEASLKACDEKLNVTRVLAADSPTALHHLINETATGDVCIWVSRLNELTTTAQQLSDYGLAIRELKDSNRRSFALYGGFFSVLLSAVGLGGASHGIGYGEARDWRELPRSGPPPSRYYLGTVHRYVSHDDAHQLWLHNRHLVGDGSDPPPINLHYHDLMLHSVQARSEEITNYSGLDLQSSIDRLRSEQQTFLHRLNHNSPSRLVHRIGTRTVGHLETWLEALEELKRYSKI